MAAAGRRTTRTRASPRAAAPSPPAITTPGLRTPPGGDRCRGLAARRRATRTWTAITTPTATATSTATRGAAGRATATARGTASTTRRGRNRSTRSRMHAGRAISDRPAPAGDRRAGAAASAGATALPIVAGETAAGTAAASAGAAASPTAVSEAAASAGGRASAAARSVASADVDRHHDRTEEPSDPKGEGDHRGVGIARGRGNDRLRNGIQENRGEPQQAAHQLLHGGGRHPRASEREGEHAPADGGGAADHRPHQHRGGPRLGHFQDQRPGRERRVPTDDRRADRGDQDRVWASLGAPMPAGLRRRQRP